MALAGVFPASVTPFDLGGQVGMPAVARLLAWFRANGCAGVVFAGTNGEGPSLSTVEKRDLVRGAVPLADGLDVILGIATASLEEAVWSCRQAHSAGARAALVMAPAYFRDAGDEGIAQWFEALLDRSPLDVLVYNFPQRTGITLSPELMFRLSKRERMIGLKDSSGNAANVADYAEALRGTGRSMFVGDETLLVEALRAGWSGTISGAANVLPNWISAIVADWSQARESAETKHALILPALQALRRSPQPGANKVILRRLGVLETSALRLPLIAPEETSVDPAWEDIRKLHPQRSVDN
jgi:4-hydroxy-tetrahydrodipicolinate synthase